MTKNNDNETKKIIHKGDGVYNMLEFALKFVGNVTHGECYNRLIIQGVEDILIARDAFT